MTRFLPLSLATATAAGLFGWASVAQVKDKRQVVPVEAEQFASMRDLIDRYETDRRALERFYGWRVLSESHRERLEAFNDEWAKTLNGMDFGSLSHDQQIDYVLMRHRLEYSAKKLVTDQRKLGEIESLVGFRSGVLDLYESYRAREEMEPRSAAEKLARLTAAVKELTSGVTTEEEPEEGVATTAVLAQRAQKVVSELQRRLDGWYKFYAGFDPEFTWWAEEPQKELKAALEGYEKKLGEIARNGKVGDKAPLVGDPIGAEALADDLAVEMLAYSPEELLEIGEREFAWCRAEMKRAARELGFGDDWHKALEKVKEDFVPPGEQDDLAADIARDGMKFLDDRDLVTVPDLCRETWYLTMLGKKEQETLPYAVYRGQAIGIAFPTDEMSVEKKLMSLRGNNRHFTRAVIPHELVPGHHLQRFMAQRHNSHRRIFSTPF